MFRRNGLAQAVESTRRVVSVVGLAGVVALSLAAAGCGGSPPGNNVPHPLVRQFSPTMSPIDFNTLQANPTFTDGMLTISTDPLYPGKICVFFQAATKIDPASVFLGGNPALGIDLSALQILNYQPGVGNVPLQPAPNGVQVLGDRIIFTPAVLPLPNGQYSIGVFGNIKSTEGDAVQATPVFHSFTVGTVDTIPPTVVVTDPVNGEGPDPVTGKGGVGAGIAPPAPPSNLPSTSIASVHTAIFGPVSPDITIRFSEAIDASTVNVNNISVSNAAFNPPPLIVPAPGFPKLKSQLDASTLPSNGFEVVWRSNPVQGGLPFGTQVQVTVVGLDNGAHVACIKDRSGNALQVSYTFQFQTIGRPKFPANPEPEFSIWWSASDRIGTLDCVNQLEIAKTWLGQQTTPIVRNVVVDQTDKISTKQTLGVIFDPLEISIDTRTSGASCHTYAYIQSNQGGQILIINTRQSMPVAIINTSSPGGLSNQTGIASSNVLLATNAFANTYTVFDVGNITPGLEFLNGPITISEVVPTGNNPRAISISGSRIPGAHSYNRDDGSTGPGTPLIFYADFTDGVVKTGNLGKKKPVKLFALGSGSAPNDVAQTPCIPGGNRPAFVIAAISEAGGGLPGSGAVSYYVSGPNCETGVAVIDRPDAIIGTLPGFEAPAGLDEIFSFSLQAPPAIFAMAESGANKVDTLTIENGTLFLPRLLLSLDTGANPVAVAHRCGFLDPITGGGHICTLFTPGCPVRGQAFQPPPCWYGPQGTGTEQYPLYPATADGGVASSVWLYVCTRGVGRIECINSNDGSVDFYSPTSIAGIRFVAAPGSQ